ncbi:hypothetical protein NP493_1552g00008 [Ridgeia piscesae]|uniref:Tetraspanin-31 n=1 Tax=Ridgeia piscesae TaxID=27915 RepID=A0AAD9JZ57_RIDPI|nr:hypothetical protein NP493_1552g00008 [Ridgeia piscesae]
MFQMVACLLIGVAATARIAAKITNVSLMGGLIACGVILLLIAVVGLVGAVRHHQVFLFFYMIILFLLFLVQFAVACACLALTPTQQKGMLAQGWAKSTSTVKANVQIWFDCCSFNNSYPNPINDTDCSMDSLLQLKCCSNKTVEGSEAGSSNSCLTTCPKCVDAIREHLKRAIKLAGIIGLIFSLTEV